MSKLNNRDFIISIRNGTFANLQAAWALGQFSPNEPVFTTDNNKLYMSDSTGTPQLVGFGLRVSKTANYTINTQWDIGTKFDNQGASGTVVLTLPTTWGSNTGVYYEFCCAVAQLIQIAPVASAKIALGSTNSTNGTGGGYIRSNTPFSYLVIEGLGSGVQWVVRSATGTWVVN